MAIYKQRLAPRAAVGSVFATCVLTVQAWAFFNLFREVPALRIRMGFWEMLGVLAYVQAFALLESLLVLLLLVGLGVLLPARLLRAHFAAQGSALVLLSAGWALLIHLGPERSTWFGPLGLLWLAGYGLSVGAAWWAIRRYPQVEAAVAAFAQRLVVLALLYAGVGLLSVAVVIARNL